MSLKSTSFQANTKEWVVCQDGETSRRDGSGRVLPRILQENRLAIQPQGTGVNSSFFRVSENMFLR